MCQPHIIFGRFLSDLRLIPTHPKTPPTDIALESVTREEQHVLGYLENAEIDHLPVLSLSDEECLSGLMNLQSMPHYIVNCLKQYMVGHR
jgi:hypothetical protein